MVKTKLLSDCGNQQTGCFFIGENLCESKYKFEIKFAIDELSAPHPGVINTFGLYVL